MVSLVGAGPGAPDLITVRGLHRLQAAEVVVHDRLVSPQLIAQAPDSAKLINVGKAPHKRRFPQEEINRILVEEAMSGKRVVRLKGGDPFIFGLGSSEALALVEARQFHPNQQVLRSRKHSGAMGCSCMPKLHHSQNFTMARS